MTCLSSAVGLRHPSSIQILEAICITGLVHHNQFCMESEPEVQKPSARRQFAAYTGITFTVSFPAVCVR